MEIKQPREIKTLHSLSLVFTHRTSVTIEMMIKILFCSNYWHSLDINSSLLSSRCMINFTARPYSLIVSSGMHIRKNQSVLETNELYRSLDLMEQKVDPLVAVSHWGCKSLCELGEVDNRARDAPLFIYRSFPQLAELPKLISCRTDQLLSNLYWKLPKERTKPYSRRKTSTGYLPKTLCFTLWSSPDHVSGHLVTSDKMWTPKSWRS